MKFKRTLNVVIDNFRIVFKLLVYQLIVLAVSAAICAAVIIPFFNSLSDVGAYINLTDSFSALFKDLFNGYIEDLPDHFAAISSNFDDLMGYLSSNPAPVALCIAGIVLAELIRRFLLGLGNYSAASLINDKMAMQANSPFFASMIKNLGKASLYNVIYVPISFIYDAACVTLLYFILFRLFWKALPLLVILFLFVVCMVLLTGIKMMFTTDWLPSIICGKRNVTSAMAYSFARKSGDSLSVYSYFSASCVMILGINVLAAISTIGAALIVTVPLSYIYILCYELVNYCDNNDIKYFTDKRTIIKPEHETETSREQFLRGE